MSEVNWQDDFILFISDVPDLESVTDSPMTRSFVNVDANANSLDMVDTSPEKAVINMESLSNNPQDQVNASQLEIRLLHSEIETLNNEMASMVNRAKSSENGTYLLMVKIFLSVLLFILS